MILSCVLAVLAFVGPLASANKNPAFSFLQDISFRSTYLDSTPVSKAFSTLPFKAFGSASKGNVINARAVDGKSSCANCFLALSPDKVNIFASHCKGTFSTEKKLALENPYSDWASYVDMSTLSTISAAESALILVEPLVGANAKDSFYIVTESNIIAVAIQSSGDNQCGCSSLVKTNSRTILSAETAQSWGDVLFATASDQSIWLFSSKQGLVKIGLTEGKVEQIQLNSFTFSDVSTTALKFIPQRRQLMVGTDKILYTLTYSTSDTLLQTDHEWITGVIDSAPLDFSYDEVNGNLWLAQAYAVHRQDSVGRWFRFGYHQNSPFIGTITSVVAVNGQVWVGSGIGLAKVNGDADPSQADSLHVSLPTMSSTSDSGNPNSKSGSDPAPKAIGSDPWAWKLYAGHRFLPDNQVISLAASSSIGEGSGQAVVVVTSSGLALIHSAPWTLEEKQLAFQAFQYPRHDRHKLTSSVNLASYGDVNSYVKRVDDNDGLWTSMHGMGEAYNFAVTGSVEARKEAWRAFEGLEMLNNVTGGYPRYPARTFCIITEVPLAGGCPTDPNMPDGQDDWHNADQSVFPGYRWKGDTSSDEMDGHLAFMPLAYDLVAQTEEEKARVYRLIDGLTGGIVAADMNLVDPTTQKPTTWGFWGPSQVNDNPDHYSERGTNSLGALAYLASAYSITRKSIYRTTFLDLAYNHGYIRNSLNVKIDNPGDDNHSDNELITMTLHTLFYAWDRVSAATEPEFREEMRAMVSPLLPAAMRTWQIIGGEFSPLWTGILAGLLKLPVAQSHIDNSVWTMVNWAIDLIDWPIDNSQRADADLSPYFVRDSTTPIIRMIRPPSERQVCQWNNDPFASRDGSGSGEVNPAVYRFPYFLMKYYGLI